jgi:hypothetical protein
MMRRPLAGLVVPLVLTAVGIVLLLNTLGVLPWERWSEIGRFWPVLVIAVGLGIFWKNVRFR